MIGAGAIALGLGVAGYSMGSSLALLYAFLLILLNWWVLILDKDEFEPVGALRKPKRPLLQWPLLMSLFGVATALELGLASEFGL